jgi:hypothetical protein
MFKGSAAHTVHVHTPLLPLHLPLQAVPNKPQPFLYAPPWLQAQHSLPSDAPHGLGGGVGSGEPGGDTLGEE